MTKSHGKLIFIDTNILLDFYRSRNDASLALLRRLDSLYNQIIITCQVEMEFNKNRQGVIQESLKLLKHPESQIVLPAFLKEAKTVELMKEQSKDTKKRVDKLKKRIESLLAKPTLKDPVYREARRLFINNSSLNLKHESNEFKLIRQRALQRFMQGMPPRKKDDTSIGDAINWEWIIACAEKSDRDVIIVSRDADYGLVLDEGVSFINDWLSQEFKKRISQKRKIQLTDRLATALDALSIKITLEEKSSEERGEVNSETLPTKTEQDHITQ